MRKYQITQWCHRILTDHVREGDLCIDATAGNGHDTLALCRLAGDSGMVLAFDIQPEALAATQARLAEHGLSHRARLIQDSHIYMEKYAAVKSVDCIVFNLGYLPGGDHTIATTAETSLAAIAQGLSLLKENGLMSLCIYSGGDTGFDERSSILTYLKDLDPRKYMVIVSSYYNRPNHPPIPALIYKLKH